MKVNLSTGKPRASFECKVEQVDDGWRATAVLRNRLEVVLDRQVRVASTEWEARAAAEDALDKRWTWQYHTPSLGGYARTIGRR